MGFSQFRNNRSKLLTWRPNSVNSVQEAKRESNKAETYCRWFLWANQNIQLSGERSWGLNPSRKRWRLKKESIIATPGISTLPGSTWLLEQEIQLVLHTNWHPHSSTCTFSLLYLCAFSLLFSQRKVLCAEMGLNIYFFKTSLFCLLLWFVSCVLATPTITDLSPYLSLKLICIFYQFLLFCYTSLLDKTTHSGALCFIHLNP